MKTTNKVSHMTGYNNPKVMICSLLALASATIAAPSFAEDNASNSPPVCVAKTEVIKPLPDELGLGAFSIDPIKLEPACTDADGDPLTLVEVSSPATLDPSYGIHIDPAPAPGQTLVLNFTVSDGRGGTATSTLTIVRQ